MKRADTFYTFAIERVYVSVKSRLVIYGKNRYQAKAVLLLKHLKPILPKGRKNGLICGGPLPTIKIWLEGKGYNAYNTNCILLQRCSYGAAT